LSKDCKDMRYTDIRSVDQFGSAAFARRVVEGQLEGLALDADGGVSGRVRDRVGPVNQYPKLWKWFYSILTSQKENEFLDLLELLI